MGDGLFGCGEGFQIAKDAKASYIFTFKEGRLPTAWQDFQGLLQLCPNQRVELTTPAGVRHVYRWVHDLSYTDTKGRSWTFTAIQCDEIHKDGTTTLWAWVTDLEVNHDSVVEVATKGGRDRWLIENQGYKLFGSLKNMAMRLLESVRYLPWPTTADDAPAAARMQIRFNSS